MSGAVSGVRSHRSWPQRLLITANCLFAVIALLVAGGLAWANVKTGSVQRVSLGRSLTAEPTSSSAPQNFLLVGTDSAAGLSPNDPAVQGRGDVGGARSDTMMILRVVPSAKKALLLAIPRDLWVPIYDASGNPHGESKLNSAIEYGGAPALVRTIEENFHLPIHHYVQVDWEGFKGVVKAIGGVPVYFDTPVRDRDCNETDANGNCVNHTGLDVAAPGCVVLGPDQALGFVRSRYFEYQNADGEWVPDGTSDLGRASRQQLFIQQALKKAVSKGIRNPVVLNDLTNAMLKSVTIDENLTPGDILDLGRRFQSFDPANLEKLALPVTDSYVGDASVQELVPGEAEAVFARFRDTSANGASTLDPASVTVQVLNGSGAYNQATDVTGALEADGFKGLDPGDAESPGPQTTVRYLPGREQAAQLVARYLDAPVTFEPAQADQSADVLVITSASFGSVLSSPKPADQVRGPTTTTTTTTSTTTAPPTDSAGTGTGTDTGSTGSTGTGSSTTAPDATTTTLPGYAPTMPPGVSCG